MITKIDNATMICTTSKKWEMKDKGTSGIVYNVLIYSDKRITNCKTDEILHNRLKDKEFVKGTAVIEIIETNYNNKQGVSYILKEFGENK